MHTTMRNNNDMHAKQSRHATAASPERTNDKQGDAPGAGSAGLQRGHAARGVGAELAPAAGEEEHARDALDGAARLPPRDFNRREERQRGDVARHDGSERPEGLAARRERKYRDVPRGEGEVAEQRHAGVQRAGEPAKVRRRDLRAACRQQRSGTDTESASHEGCARCSGKRERH